MTELYVYTLFDGRTGRPRYTTIVVNGQRHTYELYKPGAGKPVYIILNRVTLIGKIIAAAYLSGAKVILSGCQRHLKQFQIELADVRGELYDIQLPCTTKAVPSEQDQVILDRAIERTVATPLLPHHKLVGTSAIVYNFLTMNGVKAGYCDMWPVWSVDTFSGRSKSSGFNIQGATDDLDIRLPLAAHNDVYVFFDWMAADIRVASLLAQDDVLAEAFLDSDPYVFLAGKIGELSRDEAKLYLLKTINSLDIGSEPVTKVYHKLWLWMRQAWFSLQSEGATMLSLLGREFRRSEDRNQLAVFNAAMQGSVAHAMQAVLGKLWMLYPTRLLAEMHDSVVLMCPSAPIEVKAMIEAVTPIMTHPFDGILDYNPVFPVKVSIGKHWRKWVPYAEFRS